MDRETMEAGPGLDRLVAEQVMGWAIREREGDITKYDSGMIVRPKRHDDRDYRPSADIKQAWEVAEKLRATGWDIAVESMVQPAGQWRARLSLMPRDQGPIDPSDAALIEAIAETAPLAICRAAVLALAPKE